MAELLERGKSVLDLINNIYLPFTLLYAIMDYKNSNRKSVDKMKMSDAKKLIGCCGLYCGLCAKYQSQAPSRCMGCQLGEQHSWCSIWNCCVKKKQLQNCTECSDRSTCAIFERRKVMEWIPVAENIRQIHEIGIAGWLKEQKVRQALLEDFLENYNEGRSMNFYCKTFARMPIQMIQQAIKESKVKLTSGKVDPSNRIMKAKILKKEIIQSAFNANINLK